MKTVAAIFALFAGASSLSAQVYSLIPGGDFEPPLWPGAVPGFTLQGGATIISDAPIHGLQSLRLPAFGDALTLTLSTTPGFEYSLNFWMRANLTAAGGTAGLDANLLSGGTQKETGGLFANADISDRLVSPLTWTATGSEAVVQIKGVPTSTGWVDDIQVAAVVPEPNGSALAFALGLAAFLSVRRALAR